MGREIGRFVRCALPFKLRSSLAYDDMVGVASIFYFLGRAARFVYSLSTPCGEKLKSRVLLWFWVLLRTTSFLTGDEEYSSS